MFVDGSESDPQIQQTQFDVSVPHKRYNSCFHLLDANWSVMMSDTPINFVGKQIRDREEVGWQSKRRRCGGSGVEDETVKVHFALLLRSFVPM